MSGDPAPPDYGREKPEGKAGKAGEHGGKNRKAQ